MNPSLLAPLAAFGATWLARKALTSAYSKRTGHAPPIAEDVEVPIGRVIAWTVVTAAVSATIEVAILRASARYQANREATTAQIEDS